MAGQRGRARTNPQVRALSPFLRSGGAGAPAWRLLFVLEGPACDPEVPLPPHQPRRSATDDAGASEWWAGRGAGGGVQHQCGRCDDGRRRWGSVSAGAVRTGVATRIVPRNHRRPRCSASDASAGAGSGGGRVDVHRHHHPTTRTASAEALGSTIIGISYTADACHATGAASGRRYGIRPR